MTGQAPLRAAAEALLAKLAGYRLSHVLPLFIEEATALETALATPPPPAELHQAMLEAAEACMGKVIGAGAERDVEVDALVDAIEAYERRIMPEFRLPENYGAWTRARGRLPREEVRRLLMAIVSTASRAAVGLERDDTGEAHAALNQLADLEARLLDSVALPRDAIRRALDAAYELGWDARDAGTTDVAAAQVRRAASEVRLSELLDSVAPER